MNTLATLTPAQEPALWGAVATAILEVVVVFAPSFGIHISVEQQTALGALIVAVIPIVVGLFVRQNTTPTAPPPTPAPVPTPPPSVP